MAERKLSPGSALRLIVVPVGFLQTNCFIVQSGRQAMIIDPGDDIKDIENHLAGLKPEFILLTHSHYDHIGAAGELRKICSCPLYCSAGCSAAIQNPALNFSYISGRGDIALAAADRVLKDGEIFMFAGLEIEARATPGHTPDSMSFILDHAVFTGDLLFHESVGRTDFPGGNSTHLQNSIYYKIFSLPDNTVIYPGHGTETSVAHEKNHNPFISQK